MWEGDTRGAESLRIEAAKVRHQVTKYLLRTVQCSSSEGVAVAVMLCNGQLLNS